MITLQSFSLFAFLFSLLFRNFVAECKMNNI